MSKTSRRARLLTGRDSEPASHVSQDWMSRLAGRVKVVGDGCWQVGNDPTRYAQAKIEGHYEYIHRLVYMNINGAIPDGWYVHHECQRPACINPAHLVTMSHADHQALHAKSRKAS